MIKPIREGFGNRLQFTISVNTPKTYGDSRSDAVKDFTLKFWKDFVYSPDSDILDDLGIPVTGTTDCKCEVDDKVVYLYPRLDLTDIKQQDLSHTAFELNKTNTAKDYKAHFGYGWSTKMKSLYIQLPLPNNLRRESKYAWGPIGTESVKKNRRRNRRIKESFYDKQYSIDNIIAWLQDSGSRGARKITDFFGKGIILADDTESFLNSQPLETLQEFEREVGIDFDSVFGRGGFEESKKSKRTKRIQEQLSVDDKKFKEAVRFCNSTVEDLADELWRRYVDLEDAISCVKTFYENGRGRRSLLADIESHVNAGDLKDVIEDVYFNNDQEMNSIRKNFGRV